MPRPVIGLTAYLEPARWGAWDTPAVVLHERYIGALRAAGARVVVLPPDDVDAEVLDRLDALVLTGGADVDPARYAAAAHPTTDVPRTLRDAGELLLYAGARSRGMPVLGICRGMQVMAVAEGGRLHQNVPDLDLGVVHRERPGAFTRHEARFAAGSLAARILGLHLEVNSSHHQVVEDAGRLTVTGWAADDTIETCEDGSAPFVLGVQWHPEYDDDPRLFDALVAATA